MKRIVLKLERVLSASEKRGLAFVASGARVQIIKRDAEKGGVLRLGTEWSVTSKEPLPRSWGHRQGRHRRADYVGSAGKSIWRSRFQPQWQATLKAIVPSYGRKLNGM